MADEQDRPDAQQPEMPALPAGPTVPIDHLLPQEAGEAHPMVEAALGGAAGGDLLVRMLYDEQTRLRGELDELKKKSSEKEEKGGDEKGGDDKGGGDSKGGDDEEGGDDEKGDDKKDGDEKKEEKPPLKERVHEAEEKGQGWVREHPIITVAALVGLVVLVIATIFLVHYLNSYVDTDDAFIDGHTDPMSFRVSGIVSAVYVENTYRVRKGQLLAQLDGRDNEVAKEQASANYAQAQASTRAQSPNVPIVQTDQLTRVQNEDFNVVNARAQIAAADERFRASMADLQQAEAQAANAAREEERYRLLVVKEEVTREQYDQRATEARANVAVVKSRGETAAAASRAVVQAEAQLGQAQAQARQAREDTPRQVQMQREMVAQRKAAELAAKAQADQAELNLEYTRLYAPEDGVIGDKQVQVATQVAPGRSCLR